MRNYINDSFKEIQGVLFKTSSLSRNEEKGFFVNLDGRGGYSMIDYLIVFVVSVMFSFLVHFLVSTVGRGYNIFPISQWKGTMFVILDVVAVTVLITLFFHYFIAS